MTTTSALPFSPLTHEELNKRQQDDAWKAACALTYHDRYGGTLEQDARRAITHARSANAYHAAACARIDRVTP